MGRTGASLGAGRFVPRGEDGGSIDASLMVVMEEDRRWSLSCRLICLVVPHMKSHLITVAFSFCTAERSMKDPVKVEHIELKNIPLRLPPVEL